MIIKNKTDNESLLFAEETIAVPEKNKAYFKLLIVDDENEVHIMTKLVLSDYHYNGAGLEFLSAFSGKEAKDLIVRNPDIACILLDVVMETKDAGLEVARFIREDEKNTKVRIVLRTGQPGRAPEKKIILNYDINDYKEKTELTDQKLFTTITTALRSYKHLMELEEKTKEIESKNIRLNEEIARRIVAESNLTKYNRSLEKMIGNKSCQLEKAIITLKEKERELLQAKNAIIVSDISCLSIDTLDISSNTLQSNLRKMNQFRQEMTLLLEKYNTLQEIIASNLGLSNIRDVTSETIKAIEQYKTRIDLDTILKDYPDIIRDSALGIEKITSAVSDIKLFMSVDKEQFETTDIHLLVEEAVKAVQKNFGSSLEVQLDLNTVPDLLVPQKNLKKALMAVIENSFHAIQPRGIVSISCVCRDLDIIICISDLGCGIAPQDLPHIFTPYYKGNKKSGKGLGLCLARSIILNCNGSIEITSTLHEGTTATIILPIGHQAGA